MERYFKIGEMSMLNHVSTQALRLYAKNKLLEPEYQDEATGYRYYTLGQCAKLDLIHALKSCRLSLEEIRTIFSLSSPDELAKVLEIQETKLENEIYDLSVSRNNLSHIRKNLQILSSLPPFGQPYFEFQPERLIDVHHTDYDFYVEGYASYEQMIREMQNYLFENHLAPSYFINIGTIVSKENFDKAHFTTNQSFIFVDELYPIKDHLKLLPQGMYLCIASDNTDLELEYAHKLHQELKKQGMHSAGDYLCEVLTQFPFNSDHKLVYKIQIPITK